VPIVPGFPHEDFLVLCDLYDPECETNPDKSCSDYEKNKGWCGVRSASGGRYLENHRPPGVPMNASFTLEVPEDFKHFQQCAPDRVKLNISTFVECMWDQGDGECAPTTRVYFYRLSQGNRHAPAQLLFPFLYHPLSLKHISLCRVR